MATSTRTEQTACRLDTLQALTSTELTSTGLAHLLVRWVLESVPACQCTFLPTNPEEGGQLVGSKRSGTLAVTAEPASTGVRVVPTADDGPSNRIAMTVAHEGESFGTLVIQASGQARFEIAHHQACEDLVAHFAFLMHHRAAMERARNLAIRDELTGLYNRRYLCQELEQSVQRARCERFPVSVLLLDVDHFKHFNDTWGHLVGDQVLCTIGKLMQSVFRADDLVCRFGGEEFAVLLRDHRSKPTAEHPTQVLRFAERLRRQTQTLPLTSADGQALSRITISGGIATYPWDAGSAEELLRQADNALYLAKRSGRNQVCLASRTPSSKAI